MKTPDESEAFVFNPHAPIDYSAIEHAAKAASPHAFVQTGRDGGINLYGRTATGGRRAGEPTRTERLKKRKNERKARQKQRRSK